MGLIEGFFSIGTNISDSNWRMSLSRGRNREITQFKKKQISGTIFSPELVNGRYKGGNNRGILLYTKREKNTYYLLFFQFDRFGKNANCCRNEQ